jgi:hypothetical protein
MTERQKGFMETLEQEVRKVLRDKNIEPAERLKAIEVGAKLLAIRHKIEDGIGGQSGSFFAK